VLKTHKKALMQGLFPDIEENHKGHKDKPQGTQR